MLKRVLRWGVICVGFTLIVGCGRAPTAEPPTPTPIPTPIIPTKPTYTVARGEVIRQLEFTGRITPVVQQELFFRVAGRILLVSAKRGEKVKAGQILASLETGAGGSAYDQQRAEIQLEMAQINLDWAKSQFANKYELGLKEHEVALAQLALDQITSAITGTQIIAPFDGQILETTGLSEGRGVEAFKPVAVVADVNHLEVSAELQTTELQQLSEGLPTTVVLVGQPSEELTGSIRHLPFPYGSGSLDDDSADGGTEGQSARVSLDQNPVEGGYELGDLVRVTVILERKADVLWLPPQAIRTFEGRKFVVVQDDTGQHRVDVKVGIESDDRVEILEGATEGQIIVGL